MFACLSILCNTAQLYIILAAKIGVYCNTLSFSKHLKYAFFFMERSMQFRAVLCASEQQPSGVFGIATIIGVIGKGSRGYPE